MSTTKTDDISVYDYLSSLESKHVVSDVVDSFELSSFAPNDKEIKIKIMDFVITKLTAQLLLFDDSKQPKNYPLSNNRNKQVLIDGYIKNYAYNDLIPTDIISFIFKLYDTSLKWMIEGESMDKFRNCEYKDVMHGPQFEMNGVKFELTLCPMGWGKYGYIACYLEIISKPEEIESVTYSITMYILDSITRVSKNIFSVNGGMGVNNQLISFDTVSKLDQLMIECDANVLYIEYKNDAELHNEPLMLCTIPEIKDTEFVWNVDDELLKNLKKTTRKRMCQSPSFADNCLILEVMILHNDISMGIKVLRVPPDIKEYSVSIKWFIQRDNKQQIIKNTQGLKMGDPNWISTEFKFDELMKTNVLSFRVEITIDKVVRFCQGS